MEEKERRPEWSFGQSWGDLNSYVLDSLRGLEETIQYGQEEERRKGMAEKSIELGTLQKKLSRMEGNTRALTNLLISFKLLWHAVFHRIFIHAGKHG